MKVIISGTSNGIGLAIARKFLENRHEVVGLDILPSALFDDNYTHLKADVRGVLPEIYGSEIVITCAGVQLPDEDTIDVNLKGTINVVEKYALQPKIKAVVAIASASGINGAEFPRYSASKGGVITYAKNVALRIAKYGATSNSVSPGGVLTESNAPVLKDPELRAAAINESLLKKWCEPEEIADLVYFLAVVNKSMTGQNLLIDNGEMLSSNFIWPEE